MSDTEDTEKKTLSLKRTVDAGHVRQNFSRGRSKSVLVEKKRRRAIPPAGAAVEAAAPPPPPVEKPAEAVAEPVEVKAEPVVAAPTPAAPTPAPVAPAPAAPTPVAPTPAPAAPVARTAPAPRPTVARRASGAVLRTLTKEEQEARARALAGARVREAQQAEQAIVDAKNKEVADAQKRELDAIALKQAEADAIKAAEEAKEAAADASAAAAKLDSPVTKDTGDADKGREKRPEPAKRRGGRQPTTENKPATPSRRGEPQRQRGRLTISNALDDRTRQRSLASIKRKRDRARNQGMGSEPREKISREVVIPDVITIQELANRMAERGVELIKILMKQGEMVKITDVIDTDTAELLVQEFGHTVKRVSEADVEEAIFTDEDEDETLLPRHPVVTVMGHVDHGKTSLLDAMRETNVVSGEAGGITQHIGAYQIEIDGGQKITFIDTPGHAAFTAMRQRGASVTDIVILVVAADDGVMPQTIEAINHAKAADVPIILAVNKMDLPAADPMRVRNELLQHEVITEANGGDVQEIEVSALKGTGLDKLREAILLQAEFLELKANPNRAADGIVIEAKLDRGRGPVATVLVQRGTLKVGDIFVAGAEWGKVRALINDKGENLKEVGPSMPVEVLGLSGTPDAGDQFGSVPSEGKAREITEYRQRKQRDSRGSGVQTSLEQMMSKLSEAGKREFPIVVKSDVRGSSEAIVAALEAMGTDEVAVRIIHAGVGGITESDVALAGASGAVVMGFNVRANAQARQSAEANNLEIRYYSVIYNLVDDIKDALSGMLSPTIREEFLGNAEILEIFNISKTGKIAGFRVTEGMVKRGAKVRLIRDDVVIHEGELKTLKRFKDEVKDVVSGQECGMAFEKYEDMRAGDVIECFETEEIARTL